MCFQFNFLAHLPSTSQEINVKFGKLNRMWCKRPLFAVRPLRAAAKAATRRFWQPNVTIIPLAVLIPAWYERTPAARLTVASAATAPASSNGKIRKGTAVSRSVQTPRVPETARSDGAVSPGIKRDCLDGARQVHGMEPAVAPRLPAGTIVSADGSFIPERSRNGKTIR
jgi:hypothetical protein